LKFISKFLFLALFIFSFISFVDAKVQEDVRLLADHFESSNNTIIATGRVLVLSKSIYINAKKVLYHRKTKQLEVFDGFELQRGDSDLIVGNYTLIKLDSKQDIVDDVFYFDKNKKLWIQSVKMSRNDSIFTFGKGKMSSCGCNNPDWAITFDSGSYNANSSFLSSYNSLFEIKDMPIFYFPYFAISTLSVRKSGLLYPKIGYTNKEGLLYQQAYFYAPDIDYDFEYRVNIKTKRGIGGGINYRHIPTKDIKIDINTFAFVEYSKYQKEEGIKNNVHYGFEATYLQNNFILNKNNDANSLYVDINEANDPLYYKLKSIQPLGANSLSDDSNYDDDIKELTTSQLVYFYNHNNLYFQTSVNWHKSITNKDNNAILQEAPRFILHKFSSQIYNFLSYSWDIDYANYYRSTKVNAQTAHGKIKLNYGYSFFDDYIDLDINENINSFLVVYSNNDGYGDKMDKLTNGYSYDLSTDIAISSQLVKPYNSTIHHIGMYASYSIPNYKATKGDVYATNTKDDDIKNIALSKTSGAIVLNLGVKNSFYSKHNKKLQLKQSILQSIAFKDNGTLYGDIENSFYYYFLSNGEFVNRIYYSHELGKIYKSSSSLGYKGDVFSYKIYHIFEQKQDYDSRDETIKYYLQYTFLHDYTLSYAKESDLITLKDKKAQYGITFNDDCWSFAIKYTKQIDVGNANKFINSFYFQFELKPFAKYDLFI